MIFQATFKDAVKKVNQRIEVDADLRKTLEQYDGRSITIDVKGDARYLIAIFRDKVELTTSPKDYREDMYIQTDLDTAHQLFHEHKIDALSLMKIKTRKIGMTEINIAKELAFNKSNM